MLTLNNLLSSRLVIIKTVLFTLMLLSGVVIFTPQETQAATHAPSPFPKASNNGYGENNCKGTPAGNFNLVIYVRITYSDGTLLGYSSNFDFDIKSYNRYSQRNSDNEVAYDTYQNAKYNSIIYRYKTSSNTGAVKNQGPGPKTYYVRMQDTTATTGLNGANSAKIFETGQGNACVPGDSAGFQPAYAFRDGDNTNIPNCWPNGGVEGSQKFGCIYDSDNGRNDAANNDSHILSCLGSSATAYKVSNVKVHDVSGGQWQGASVNGMSDQVNKTLGTDWAELEPAINQQNRKEDYEINNKSATLVFNYVVPITTQPNTPKAVFTPAAGINGAVNDEIEAASSATATASITNSGNGAGSVNWVRRFWYDNGDELFRGNGNGDQEIAALTGTSALPPPPVAGYQQIHDSSGPWSLGNVDGTYAKICTALQLISAFTGNGVNNAEFSPSPNAGVCYKIVRKPYFQVYNGDVNTAMRFCDEMSEPIPTDSAGNQPRIRGYTISSTDHRGAGTSIAAFSLGRIDQFISAMNGSTKPKYLTFANDYDPWPYGGNGGNAIAGCMTKETIPSDAPGGLTIDDAAVNGASSQTTWYSKGDIYITATNTGSKYGSFSLSDVPSLKFVAGGNIYIDRNVTNLSGILKAENGTIYTCAVQGNLPTADNPIPDPTTCNTQTVLSNQLTGLIINGALIAKDIKLTRTYGTLSHTGPAETIYFSPEAWIQSLTPSTTTGGDPYKLNTQYDSIVSLPPVL